LEYTIRLFPITASLQILASTSRQTSHNSSVRKLHVLYFDRDLAEHWFHFIMHLV